MKFSLRKQLLLPVTQVNGKILFARIFKWGIIFLILANVAAVMFESVTPIYARFRPQFTIFCVISLILFGVEYLFRLWNYPKRSSVTACSALKKRIRYLATPLMLIDLLVLMVFLMPWNTVFDFRLLRLFRLLSLLKVTRNSRAVQMLITVIKRESRTFVEIFLVITVLLILVSAIIFGLENTSQPETFSSIPHSMWWTISTVTTVGYGDAVPQTIAGKFFGMLVMFIGIAMFAIPTGILVSSFYQEIKRKDFIATWDLVAQVPYFSGLSAKEIGTITDLLKLHVVREGEIIFRQGDVPDNMYFIVSGEVEVRSKGWVILSKAGDFFGEIGIIYKTPRMATVTAKTYAELLQLNLRDMELFLESHPQLRKRILKEAKQRRSES